MNQRDARLLGTSFVISACFLLIGVAISAKFGLFAFSAHNYGPTYQTLYLVILPLMAWIFLRRKQSPKSWTVIISIGALVGYVTSVVLLILAFVFFKSPDGFGASLSYSTRAFSEAPARFIGGFFWAGILALGWFYGIVMFGVGRSVGITR